jgi:hypothetical protein
MTDTIPVVTTAPDIPTLATITVSLSDPIGVTRVPDGDDGTYYEQPVTLAVALLDRLEARLWRDCAVWGKEILTARLSEHIDSVAADIVAAAVDSPIRRTNRWGEPTGPETTVREAIQAEVRTWLTAQADKYGNKGTDNLNTLIQRHVQRELSGEMLQAIAAGKKTVLDEITTKAAELFRDALQKAVK